MTASVETTPHTGGLSWAAAMTGRRKNPLTMTKAVQVCSADASATTVSELVARTSKMRASQTYGAASVVAWLTSRPTTRAHTR